MALHPAQHLGPILEQIVGEIRVLQRGQRKILGLDQIKVIAQFLGKYGALVTARNLHLLPALLVGIGFGGRIEGDSVARPQIPAAVGGANRFTGLHRKRRRVHRWLVGRRKGLPSGCVGVVLRLEDEAFFRDACTRREQVSLASFTGLEIARHQFHHRARGDRERHILQVERGIVVLLRGIEPERLLLAVGEVGADPACAQLLVAIHHIRQHLHERAVINARFNLGLRAHRHRIDADIIGILARLEHHRRRRHYQAIDFSALALAEPGLGQQRDVADCLD